MVLPTSGSLSASQINAEFFETNPVSLSEYQGRRVWKNGAITFLPSGQISYSDFYGVASIYFIDFLVLGGGGGGGKGTNQGSGGGGGAGGLSTGGFEVINGVTTFFPIVGLGGAGATSNTSDGQKGQDSYIIFPGEPGVNPSDIRYNYGGGGGGSSNAGNNGGAGGSGGGAGARYETGNQIRTWTGGGVLVGGRGNNGGDSRGRDTQRPDTGAWGGGGGGFSVAGESAGTRNPGDGGTGWNLNNFMGTANYRGLNNGIAGGGSGASITAGTSPGRAPGSYGGGGAGGDESAVATAGEFASGGGGGGECVSGFNGLAGGSGAIVIRYPTRYDSFGNRYSIGAGGTVTYGNFGGPEWTFHIFYGTGTYFA